MSYTDTVFRIQAIRYGTDGYPQLLRWRILPLAAGTRPETVDVATIEEAIVVAHANALYVWGPLGLVNRIHAAERPFGGLMLVDSEDAHPEAQLKNLPTF